MFENIPHRYITVATLRGKVNFFARFIKSGFVGTIRIAS